MHAGTNTAKSWPERIPITNRLHKIAPPTFATLSFSYRPLILETPDGANRNNDHGPDRATQINRGEIPEADMKKKAVGRSTVERNSLVSLGMGWAVSWASIAAVTKALRLRDCCRQVSVIVSMVSTNWLPALLCVPKESFRQITAGRSARSAALLVGSIPSPPRVFPARLPGDAPPAANATFSRTVSAVTSS